MGDRLSGYRAALDYLFERTTGGSRFGLERTTALLEVLGDPHQRLRVFHVAGTNGKGSACATLEAILRHRGFRVGKYTSPHLVDFRERFVVDGRSVDEDYVVEFIRRWTPDVERTGATFFEATTAMAFDWFVRQEVDVAVIETGLGGRLDSTNVVRPVSAGVTSIGIDHVEYLGSTRESIAFEKAGIFKAGAPASIGEKDREVAALLEQHAVERGATAVASVWRDAPPSGITVTGEGTSFHVALGGESARLRTPLAGAHQASNALLAILMLRTAGAPWSVTLDEANAGLAGVRLPGRFHREGRFIFDVAHNPDGASVLAATLKAVGEPRPLAALLTVLTDKDWRGVMGVLAPVVDVFVLTSAPTAPASRAWNVAEALSYAKSRGWAAVLEPDFDRAIDTASSLAATVLVTGSFHTVGDAMARLQVDPLAG
ncbi:MAG TPA: folylpolyglutamate synthase/dihydrofolate synthase family protein [Gemmatimonadaceae bacterium]|nr:folylpolyglutamate synthase/dihydrofolate synthase family protein [Gemmatimonadaceae bacterium]